MKKNASTNPMIRLDESFHILGRERAFKGQSKLSQ